eukprot:UN28049
MMRNTNMVDGVKDYIDTLMNPVLQNGTRTLNMKKTQDSNLGQIKNNFDESVGVQCIQELTDAEEEMSVVNEAISDFTNKFEHISSVLGKLYDEYNEKVLEKDNLIETLQKENEMLQEKMDSLEGQSERVKMIETLLKDVNNNKLDDFKRKIKDI